jgi:GTPase SAR1 family protein
VDQKNKVDNETEQNKIKLLLLGAGESGKSTIFKQMKILYGLGFGAEDQKQLTPVVYNNTIVSMKTLVQAAEELEVEIKEAETAKSLMEVSDDHEVDETVGGWIRDLWTDPGIQETYEQRAKFQLIDSADYYFDNIERIMGPEYIATVTDILKSRVRTSGIVAEKYKIDGVDCVMYDVGGQRNERKKWIHCFDDVTAVIFVAAISEYDQVLYEDNRQNRMDEAISLFDEICNSRWFEDTSMILFLNKKDLFEKKIKKVSIKQDAEGETPARFEDFGAGHGQAVPAGEVPREEQQRGQGDLLPHHVRHRHGQHQGRVRRVQGHHPEEQPQGLWVHGVKSCPAPCVTALLPSHRSRSSPHVVGYY